MPAGRLPLAGVRRTVVRVTTSSAPTSGTVWQTRLSRAAAETYEQDLETLGLDRSEALRQGLRLLHREALEQRMVQDLEQFYDGQRAPLSAVTEAQYRER